MKSDGWAAKCLAGAGLGVVAAVGVRAYLTRRPKGYRRPTWRALPEGDLLQQGFKMSRVPEDLDFIVIGSGMGGLWLSAALTKCGYKVLVLEQHYIAGGCCHAFSQNGVEFTPGLGSRIHYIGDIDMAKGLLGAVGDPEFKADWHQLGGSEDGGLYDKALFGDREPVLLRQGRDAWYAEMCKHMPGKEKLLKGWLAALDEAKKAFMPLFFAKAWQPWTQWCWLRLCCRAGLKWAGKTVHQVIEELGGDEVDEALLTFQSMDHGETPRTASFPVHAMIVSHYMNGAWFPKGGPLSLARPLVSTIFKGGGAVLVRAPVQQIQVTQGRATGVRMKKKDAVLSCRKGVVSAAGLDATIHRLLSPEDVEQYLSEERDFMHSLGQGTSCLSAFVTVKGDAKDLGLSDHNVWFFPKPPSAGYSLDDITAESRANAARLNSTEGNFFCFIGAGSLKDRSMALLGLPHLPYTCPEDTNGVQLQLPSRQDPECMEQHPDTIALEMLTDAEAEPFLALSDVESHRRTSEYKDNKKQLEELIGGERFRQILLAVYPKLEDHILSIDVSTPLSVDFYLKRTAIYGLPHTPERITSPIPRVVTKIQDLYLSGQDVTTGGWLPAVMSGALAASQILGYNPLDLMCGRTVIGGMYKAALKAILTQNGAIFQKADDIASHAHKEWCCEHHDTGCTTTAAPSKKHYMWISVPVHPGKYDCAAGIKNWKKGWAHGKKKWCCSNKGIGCEEAIGYPDVSPLIIPLRFLRTFWLRASSPQLHWIDAMALLRDAGSDTQSIFSSEELEGLILKDKKAFLKTKCAQCAGSCGLAKKYKETMAAAWSNCPSIYPEDDLLGPCSGDVQLIRTQRYLVATARPGNAGSQNQRVQREAKITKEALLEQLKEDEARKEAQEAAAKAEQRRAAEKLEEEKSQRKNQRKLLAQKAKQVESFIQQRSRDTDGLRSAVHNKLLDLYPRVKRLSLALYNQFEHPDSTEVGGPDWEEVKEIYAEARELTGMIVMTESWDKFGLWSSDDFDCIAGTGNSEIGWSNRKKLWCCLHENRGCPQQVPDVFDCESGYENWPESWSVSKKEWCCDHHHRGCHGQEMESYDCRKDLEDWHGLWSGPKKAFCCKTYALGCPTQADSTVLEQPVREEVHMVDVPAPVTVVHHVHHYTTVSEPVNVEPVVAPYDCDAGYANWRNGWSEHKKGWCCAHQSVGCSYQCQEAAMTSFQEKAWCCWHLTIGCDGAELQQSYDCSAGFANWRAGWSEGKKLWCCQHHSQGCA
eukprot:s1511_g23.t1